MTRPTPLQLEILRLLARGHTRSDVAGKLHMSEHTVRGHLRRAFRTLGVHGATHAVGECYRRELFEAPLDPSAKPPTRTVLTGPQIVEMVAASTTGGVSVRVLARRYGCSYTAARNALEAAGATFRPRGRYW